MAKRLEAISTIDHGAFIQVLRNVLEEGMQHLQRKGLVDRDQHDDGRRQVAPHVELEENRQVP